MWAVGFGVRACQPEQIKYDISIQPFQPGQYQSERHCSQCRTELICFGRNALEL